MVGLSYIIMGTEKMITFSVPIILYRNILLLLLHYNFHRLIANLNDYDFAFMNIGKD